MIDTRTKIVSQDEARRLAAKGGLLPVRTYCDPMLPGHLADLGTLAASQRLLLIVDSPPDAYLDSRARCELAASLAFVAAVTTGDAAFAQSLEAFDATPAEEQHRANFVQTVRRKSGS